MHSLIRRNKRQTEAIVAAMFSSNVGRMADEDAVAITTKCFEHLSVAQWQTALAFRVSVALISMSPLFLTGRPRAFGSLAWQEQCELLNRLEGHRLKLIIDALFFVKSIACLAYYDHIREGQVALPVNGRKEAQYASERI